MTRAFRSFFFALVCLVAGTWLLCNPRGRSTDTRPAPVSQSPAGGTASGSTGEVTAPTPPPPTASVPAAQPGSTRGFASRARLEEHWDKHGAEFRDLGITTAQGYLALAQQLRDAPAGGDLLEIVRPTDGVVSRFDRRTGAFLAFNRDGTIRTLFRPDDGERYFQRQARRVPR